MRKPTDFEVEQTIFLGGKISGDHKEFKELALYDPDTSFVVWFMENQEELDKQLPDVAMLEIVKTLGKLELIRTSTEITKLSMIVGDTRKRGALKGVIDGLRAAESKRANI